MLSTMKTYLLFAGGVLALSLVYGAPSIPEDVANDNQLANITTTTTISPANDSEFFRVFDFITLLDSSSLREQFHKSLQGQSTWLTCQFCTAAISLINLYPSVGTVQTIFAKGCSTLRYEEPSVCNGIAHLFGDEFVYIVTHSKLANSEICGLFIGPNCMDQSELDHEKWVLPLLPMKTLNKSRLYLSKPKDGLAKSNVPTANILQVSDIHLDQYYEPKAMTYCQEPLCCRAGSAATGISKPAGYWGSMGNCDLALRTVENMIATIANEHSNDYRYMIFTGDYIAHDVWNTTKAEIIRTTRLLNNLFKRTIPKDKIIIPVIGNHEGYPVDQFCPPSLGLKQFSAEWLYAELLEQWKDWIPQEYHSTFLKNGFYSRVDNNARFIVLNMNNCARLNFWIAYDYLDMGGMLTWLQQELQIAIDHNQTVYIVGHIAPDESECVTHWVKNYLSILEHYSHVIKGQFFGHTHFDEIRLYYSKASATKPIGMAYLAPSATTFNDVNPTFRIYQTNDQTGEVVDHVTYYMNITKANADYRANLSLLPAPARPPFEREYSARQDYALPNLSSQSWHNFAISLRANMTMLKKYYQHYGRYSKEVVERASLTTIKRALDGMFVQ